MNKHIDLGRITLKVFQKSPFTLKKLDIGRYAKRRSRGIVFNTEVYQIDDIGQVSIMRLKALMGLIKMESAIFTVKNKDVPLFNIDWIRAFGKETMICELYDVQLSPYPEDKLAEFQAIADRDASLENYIYDKDKPHWYDNILYPCSYHKISGRDFLRLTQASISYMKTFVRQLQETEECNREEKQAKISEYTEALFASDGPAVITVKKNFGEEDARKMIVELLYGC